MRQEDEALAEIAGLVDSILNDSQTGWLGTRPN